MVWWVGPPKAWTTGGEGGLSIHATNTTRKRDEEESMEISSKKQKTKKKATINRLLQNRHEKPTTGKQETWLASEAKTFQIMWETWYNLHTPSLYTIVYCVCVREKVW
jgi:hypothetical protein